MPDPFKNNNPLYLGDIVKTKELYSTNILFGHTTELYGVQFWDSVVVQRINVNLYKVKAGFSIIETCSLF